MLRVDAGFPADRGINLGQKRSWNLDKPDATPEDRGGKSGDVADYTAAECNDTVRALDTRRQKPVAECCQL